MRVEEFFIALTILGKLAKMLLQAKAWCPNILK
jgi:hypothetical protein